MPFFGLTALMFYQPLFSKFSKFSIAVIQMVAKVVAKNLKNVEKSQLDIHEHVPKSYAIDTDVKLIIADALDVSENVINNFPVR